MSYRIKGWSDFQHFKDRTPPWIKLYRSILDDQEWFALSGDAAKFLIMLWLLASEDKTHMGVIPSTVKIAFRLRLSVSQTETLIKAVKSWLIHDDDNMTSTCHQADVPETEGEGEGKAETEGIGIPIPSLPGLPAVEGTQGQSDVSKKPRIQKPQDPLCWVGGDKMWDGIKGSDYDKWKDAYPAVDLDMELVKMDQWLQSNPTKARKKQWRKFVTGWFNRAQEKGGR